MDDGAVGDVDDGAVNDVDDGQVNDVHDGSANNGDNGNSSDGQTATNKSGSNQVRILPGKFHKHQKSWCIQYYRMDNKKLPSENFRRAVRVRLGEVQSSLFPPASVFRMAPLPASTFTSEPLLSSTL